MDFLSDKPISGHRTWQSAGKGADILKPENYWYPNVYIRQMLWLFYIIPINGEVVLTRTRNCHSHKQN